MANYNHEAIRVAYPDKNLLICDDVGIFDRDISDTTPFEVDQALVDELQSPQIKKNRMLSISTCVKKSSVSLQIHYISKCKEGKPHSQTMTQRLQK